MKPIFQILYTSQSRRPISEEFLQSLLQVARRNNQADDITGVLVERGSCFLQLLEGPEEKVRPCFARIQQDPRHRNVLVQGECFSDSRLFGSWSMGFVTGEGLAESSSGLLQVFELGSRGQKYSSSQSLQAMLKMFAKNLTEIR